MMIEEIRFLCYVMSLTCMKISLETIEIILQIIDCNKLSEIFP